MDRGADVRPKRDAAGRWRAKMYLIGFKGVKSIVNIEFTAQQPATFWNTITPQEYGFLANVEPEVPHPRWSQSEERFFRAIGDVERRPTLLYNGYEEYVAHMY